MPFTFFAHQAPVLPLIEGHPDRWDGVALVVGSMAPDLAYVTQGWGYGPWGMPLWFDGHKLANLPTVVLAAAALSIVVRRVVLAVLPRMIPDGGVLHLHDYRNIADHTRRWWVTLTSAFVGVLTHLVLDAFTHPDGAVVEAFGFLRITLFDIGGHSVRIYSVLQYGGTVALSWLAARSLVRFGERRRFASTDGRSPAAPSDGARRVFWLITVAGVVAGVAYAVSRSGPHMLGGAVISGSKSTVIIAFCWVGFLGLVLACLGVEAWTAITSPGRSTPGGGAAPQRWSYRARGPA